MDFGNGEGVDNIIIANADSFTKNNMVTHLYESGTTTTSLNGYSGGGIKNNYFFFFNNLFNTLLI